MDRPVFLTLGVTGTYYAASFDYPAATVVTASSSAPGLSPQDIIYATDDPGVAWAPDPDLTATQLYHYLFIDAGSSGALCHNAIGITGQFKNSVSATWYGSDYPPGHKTISAIAKGNLTTLTITGHGFFSGATVLLRDIAGIIELNGASGSITVVDANTITIPINSTAYTGTYTSGGVATQTGVARVCPNGSLGSALWGMAGDAAEYSRYITVRLSGMTNTDYINYVAVGIPADLPWLEDGHDADVYTVTAEDLESTTGRYLGSVVQKVQREITLDFGSVTDGEYAALKDWANRCVAHRQPFFYIPDRSEGLAYFARVNKKYKFSAPMKKGLRDMAKIPLIARY